MWAVLGTVNPTVEVCCKREPDHGPCLRSICICYLVYSADWHCRTLKCLLIIIIITNGNQTAAGVTKGTCPLMEVTVGEQDRGGVTNGNPTACEVTNEEPDSGRGYEGELAEGWSD